MKNSVKVALGFLAGGSLILAGQIIRNKKDKRKIFTAPDGNSYKENEMYRNSQGEIFKNGKQLHFETPEIPSQVNHHIDMPHNHNSVRDNHSLPKNVNYHQKGVRHH
ncbi:hypothetical protein [Epilithonimonas arachidiradicis]|uniref:Uncharacterized protein n=1 Tax=Epilithonimonas arachidiradicis TaxID=1617282 RepID=A0A420DA18_9FLAO|nr:hypothetical protein [Epilithonimonas arachidiradicis]RKE87596.1 hypothetical protein BXY58_1714 [Epilithonimonas arachidiradicis]GGG56435.1 hypothetical protein GCM10007332_17640 [Epilithonimonas arachidiradicis]